MVLNSYSARRAILPGAIGYWYLSGLLVVVAFLFGFSLVRPVPIGQPARRDALDAVNSMDGRWYKQIATEGYRFDPAARSNVAFFPVFPLLARCATAVTGVRPEVGLLIASNVSFLAALGLLGAYARARFGDARGYVPDYAMLATALFPTACFFRLAYSEATCLLLLVAASYAMLRRWPLWSIVLVSGLATAARPVGVAVLAPLAIHIYRRADAAESPGRRKHFIRFGKIALYLPLACWGLVAFLAYQYFALGELFATFRAPNFWRIRPAVPWTEKLAALATLEPLRSVYDDTSPAFWAARDSHDLPWCSMQFANPLFFIAAVVLVAIGAWRRWLSLEEGSLVTLLILIPYVTRSYEMGMASMGRFVTVAFPLYLVLAQILVRLPGPLRAVVLSFSSCMLATYSAMYGAGYPIF